MNILVICHYGMYSDLSSSFVHQQAKAYAAQGHRVRALIPIPFGKKDAGGTAVTPFLKCRTEDGVELFYLRFLSLSRYGRKYFNAPSAVAMLRPHLSHLLTDFSPDVIHCHTIGTDTKIGVWLKQQLHSPLVATTHGSDTSIPIEQGRGAELKDLCDQVDHIVSVSSPLGDKLRTSGTVTPITSILNGFAVQHLSSTDQKQPLSFLQVGHLTHQKRVSITIQAFEAIQTAHPEATLIIIGQGPERKNLEDLCRKLNISDSVRFTGQLPNSQVLAEMAKAQFFLLPSVREGFGIVYLEAMASGCVTIGTEGEGIADLICSGENGFLVPPDDPDAIVQTVEWCLKNPDAAGATAARGQAAAQELTWTKNAEQYINLFRKMGYHGT